MALRVSPVLGGLVASALVCVAAIAQTSTDLQRPPANRYVAVGCLSREAPQPAGRGPAPLPAFIITDSRGETPLIYRLDGDASELAGHAGHTVQVEGPLSPPPANATGPNAKAMVLKVSSLIYLSPTCKFLK